MTGPPEQTALETDEDASARLDVLSDGAWALGAVAVGLRAGFLDGGALPEDDALVGVLRAVGLVVDDSGRARPAPGLLALVDVVGPASLADDVAINLRQLSQLLDGGGTDAPLDWAHADDETLLAQGRASMGIAAPFNRFVVPQLEGLGPRLGRPGARFLDIGTGVGGLAIAMCDEFPDLSVVGLDVLPRALQLARSWVAERGLQDRIELRLGDVAHLAHTDAYDLAWLPAPYIPQPALEAALPLLHRALRPGGWLVLAMGRLDGPPLSAAVTRWRTALLGGTVMPPAAAVSRLTEVGFARVLALPTPPSAPVLVAARR